ncbi:hypothetical protein BU26DRAFT_235540 [Trematosphaeria pertusa]|uniref:Uncharacterized protein n=1 Tax=Trematosphaeria pertusa TaxID=390896 RepID=A0A6A6IUK2_9PLEO|nr:uncharacterized protein BU26DRAFT_235540 [Trematosphaeria pertusa]KAF2254089.1 hypothetical protein BU26DRAFT_235540 [Trematosphaeria pertusa]
MSFALSVYFLARPSRHRVELSRDTGIGLLLSPITLTRHLLPYRYSSLDSSNSGGGGSGGGGCVHHTASPRVQASPSQQAPLRPPCPLRALDPTPSYSRAPAVIPSILSILAVTSRGEIFSLYFHLRRRPPRYGSSVRSFGEREGEGGRVSDRS